MNTMKKYGLLGGRIEHSLSPAIHQIINRRFNASASYRIYDESRLPEVVMADIKRQNISGFNVTIPYKQTIIPHLDCLTRRASKIDSVNTVTLIDGKYVGDNTDSSGFGALLKRNNVSLKNKKVLILGAGGAANAVVDQAIQSDANMVLIYNRTRARTNQLMIRAKSAYQFDNIMSVFDYHGLVVDVVVNATPLGGVQYRDIAAFNPAVIDASIYIDLVYLPRCTVAMRAAKEGGMKVIGGLDMLVYQAVEAASLWHGFGYECAEVEEIICDVRELAYT
ncbi:MAG: hypothetical protein CSB19_01500 [Clostridiales bacterium]|nr:MAG: hypothetical protein CSB19_01500 [Clostridiales bacterium]